MGWKYSLLSERQRGMITEPGMALERSRIDSEGVLESGKVKRAPRGEKGEQGLFANWLLAQGLPFVWHSTHAPSKASPGTPDFWVGVNGHSIWLEFKVVGGLLSTEQKDFWRKLEFERIEGAIVRSAAQAIELVRVARGDLK